MARKTTQKFEILNRWTRAVQFTAEITCSPDATLGFKVGLAVKWAYESGAVLSGADLSGAVLSGAVLSGADLSGAVLRGAVLRGAPIIPDIHQKVYAAASQPGALDMGSWHRDGFCGTTHCRAGWVTFLAGDEGKKLEQRMGTPAAASLIYLASDPNIDRFPNFYASNADALADMKRLAEHEAGKAV